MRDRQTKLAEILIDNLDVLDSRLIGIVKDSSLLVGDFDPQLLKAHQKEYPTELLGDIGLYVGFEYYKAMLNRSTASSSRIAKRYEEADRDITGTGVLDFLALTKMIRKEAELILAAKIDFASFETWLQVALVQVKNIYRLFESKDKKDLTQHGLSEAQARKDQARNKLVLNQANLKMAETLNSLKLLFDQKSLVLHQQVALVGDGQLEQDLENRIKLFREKVETLISLSETAKSARNSIISLSSLGKELPTHGPRIMRRDVKHSIEELEFWRSLQEADTEFVFRGRHADLLDVAEGDFHSQYLLTEGGELTGNVSALPGVRVDGVDLSDHVHNDLDGSKKIDGRDLEGSSLKQDRVDQNKKPPRPEDLNIGNLTLDINPPVSTAGATLAWNGAEDYVHELEVRRVSKEEEAETAANNDTSGIYLQIYSSVRENYHPDLEEYFLLRIDLATKTVQEYAWWDLDFSYQNKAFALTSHEGKSRLISADSYFSKTTSTPPSASGDWSPTDDPYRVLDDYAYDMASYQGNVFALADGPMAISRDGGDTWARGPFLGAITDTNGNIVRSVDLSDVTVPSTSLKRFDTIKVSQGGTLTVFDSAADEGSFFYSDDLGTTWNFFAGHSNLVENKIWETLRTSDGLIVQTGNTTIFDRFSQDNGANWTVIDNFPNSGKLFQNSQGEVMRMVHSTEYLSFYKFNLGQASWDFVSAIRPSYYIYDNYPPQIAADGALIFAAALETYRFRASTGYWDYGSDVVLYYSYDDAKTWSSLLLYREPENNVDGYQNIGRPAVFR